MSKPKPNAMNKQMRLLVLVHRFCSLIVVTLVRKKRQNHKEEQAKP
jgi:hypothetical protein